jgi:hypothetical protein
VKSTWPGRVDQVEDVLDAVDGPRQPDGLRLDGDAALALDVHAVEVLRAHVALLDDAGHLQHPVGQRRLAMVDVGDDAEVADQLRVGGHAARSLLVGLGAGIVPRPSRSVASVRRRRSCGEPAGRAGIG